MKNFRLFPLLLLFVVISVGLCGQSARTEHVEATLITEVSAMAPGEPFWVGLKLHMQPHWHIYWRNAGDAGLPTSISWTLPEGFSAGEIQWPYPKIFKFDIFVNYGYGDDVLLPVQITPPATLKPGEEITLMAKADWLVCEDICVPETVELSLTLPVANQAVANETVLDLFAETRAKLPIRLPDWGVSVNIIGDSLLFKIVPPKWYNGNPGKIHFFPYDDFVINNGSEQIYQKVPDGYILKTAVSPERGEPLKQVRGILVSENGWRGGGSEKALEIDLKPGETTQVTAGKSGLTSLWWALLFAFVGGMILNLMPCVLPVLSLKILGFVQQAGEERSKLLTHGIVFTIGVLVSFWGLAGILLLLRAGGEQLGWGFQLQSPGFIVVLSIFMFLFGLNLFGVFEVGTSLSGVGQDAASRSDYLGSFISGVTATVVATPCTAPFMGSALGFALSQPPMASMAIFTALGLGMALPYVILSASPGLLKFIPKPGPWMETLKQFMGFLLMATVIWLLFVLDGQVGSMGVLVTLLALLVASFGAWILGKWGTMMMPGTTRLIARVIALTLIVSSAWLTINTLAVAQPSDRGNSQIKNSTEHDGWIPFSPETVAKLRADGKPVFIDFTASWCLSCQVNKKIALNDAAVKAAFEQKGVTKVIADWTSKDDTITQALAAFGRNSVPLYVLYGSDPNSEPIILPELLTPGIVLDALEKIK
jgi:thiol:disulfide interchange protein DsbD